MLRATLKSLLARKLRLTLSMVAVVLSVMFVAGSFVLTDTLGRSFDALFANIYSYTDVQVGPTSKAGASTDTAGLTLPAGTVDEVRSVPGVAKATGQVFTNGAAVIGKAGKVVPDPSGQRFGASWVGEDELISLGEGRAPTADDEIVANKGLLTDSGYRVGDSVDIITPKGGRKTYKLVGDFLYAGGRETMAGEQTVFFTESVAQQTMLGKTGVYSSIAVKAAPGVTNEKLRDDIKTKLGGDFQVKTGDELAKESAQPFKDIFKYVNYVLVGFGLVAVLVGIFLILNTFSIIVAQRTQELALLRAMGASRGQVLRSVMLEALLIGVLGSAVGFLVGVGLGAGGAYALGGLTGGSLKIAGVGVPAAAAILAFVIGISVTVVAALVPALRASRVPPIAALREAAATDRPLTRITIVGGVVTVVAGALLTWGLSAGTLTLIFAGVLGLLIGVALLTPVISKPVVSVLGRLFSWSTPGKLGRRNSARNPRRTAITAAAVMIGIALVTAISTVFASLSTSLGNIVDEQLQADLVVYGDRSAGSLPVIQPDELQRIRALSGAQTVASVTADSATVNGKNTTVFAYDDVAAATTILKLTADAGTVNSLGSGQFMVDRGTADNDKLKVGDTITIALPLSGPKSYTLVGITSKTQVGDGYVVSQADAETGFRQPKPLQAFIKVRDGTDVNAVKAQVADVLKNNPLENVQTKHEYVGSATQFFNVLLAAVQVLLLVALAISILGVINTLVLSVIERTRELGMLRAIGLRRGQTMRMVTVESVVIVLFGTILGLVVGCGLGIAIVEALKKAAGFGTVTLPWGLMVVYLVAALFVGVFAAIIPAVRAARLNVLGAIAYE